MNGKLRILHTSLKPILTYDENRIMRPGSIGVVVRQTDGQLTVESHYPFVDSSVVGNRDATKDNLSKLTRNETIRVAKQCLKVGKELLEHYERLKGLLNDELEIDEPKEAKATKWEEVPEVRQPVKISTHSTSLDKNHAKVGKKGAKPAKTPKTIDLSKLQGMLGGDG